MLNAGLYDVPPGMVATVVTHLEMHHRADLRNLPAPQGCNLTRMAPADLASYRELFNRVGGQDWLWFSRMSLNDADLDAILSDENVHIYMVMKDGRAEGLLELDFRQMPDCELAFFGLCAGLIGTGCGGWLMDQAIALAWAVPIRRFHVHTCTLDHPGALSFYRRSGFTPVRQQIEIEADPRLNGTLPDTAGPHIPIFRP